MNFGYIRVSTDRQSLDSQKNVISRYCIDNKITIDENFTYGGDHMHLRLVIKKM